MLLHCLLLLALEHVPFVHIHPPFLRSIHRPFLPFFLSSLPLSSLSCNLELTVCHSIHVAMQYNSIRCNHFMFIGKVQRSSLTGLLSLQGQTAASSSIPILLSSNLSVYDIILCSEPQRPYFPHAAPRCQQTRRLL